MNVSMVITGLATGGAETMLLRLLERIDRTQFSIRVFSLTNLGEIGPRIAALGIPVEALSIRPGAFGLLALGRLARRLRETNTELVHTWMYHADLVGGLAARCAGIRIIAWGIRNTNLDSDMAKLSTRIVARINARLSRWLPMGIISCSEVARNVHVARGYAASKMAVIPNGFDVTQFRPDRAAREAVRTELALPAGTPLVGMVGRYDPLKNHAGFLDAAGMVRRVRPDAHFVLVGSGLDARNGALAAVARRAGIADSVHWLGQRNDIPRLMASFDVLALSSFGEAFPNVLGEAMACGVPCAVTDVGDSAAIVGDTGRVVSPGDMPALAAAIEALLSLDATQRAVLERQARARVEEHFEIGTVVRQYEDYYDRLARAAT